MSKTFKGSVAIIGAHPDDPDIWTGGLALLLRQMDIPVHFICVGKESEEIKQVTATSSKIHDVQRHWLDLEINENQNLTGEIRAVIPDLLKQLDVQIVIIPGLSDYHREHIKLSKALLQLFHWSDRTGLNGLEVYFSDSHEKREPIEFYVDISSVWDKHIEALRCFKHFEYSQIPDNTLIRIITGRAMLLGTSNPVSPVMYAEGYAMAQGNPDTISKLKTILGTKCTYRHPFLIKNFNNQ